MCANRFKISLVQSSIEWLQPEQNRVAAEEWIANYCDSELIIFAEMFTTGFCMTPDMCVESSNITLSWMIQMAQKYNIAIIGSVATEDGDRYYNRLYVVKSDGAYVKYDKRHLFTFAGEDENYTCGVEKLIVEIQGVRILPIVCYDLRFPAWIRNRGDYDMMVCVANWPKSRRGAWDILLKARAIENVSYVCGVNIVGEGDSVQYSGGTVALNYRGEVITLVADNEVGVATFEVDMDALLKFRGKYPVLNDADDFELI